MFLCIRSHLLYSREWWAWRPDHCTVRACSMELLLWYDTCHLRADSSCLLFSRCGNRGYLPRANYLYGLLTASYLKLDYIGLNSWLISTIILLAPVLSNLHKNLTAQSTFLSCHPGNICYTLLISRFTFEIQIHRFQTVFLTGSFVAWLIWWFSWPLWR